MSSNALMYAADNVIQEIAEQGVTDQRSQSPQRTIISERIPHAFMFSVIIWTGQQAGTRCPKSFLLLIAGD